MTESRIRSVGRTTGRLTPARRRLLATAGPRFLIDAPHDGEEISLAPGWELVPLAEFGRRAPLVIEVGSGDGEQSVAYAASHPETDVLAVEVFWEGVAGTIARAEAAGLTNLRILRADASLEVGRAIPAGAAAEVWTFFPDPWPKARHHKRRLVSPEFAAAVARALAPGGVWRLATDSEPYAVQMAEVIAGEPALALEQAAAADGFGPRWDGRIATRYERKAREAGSAVRDLTATRR